MIRIIQGVGLVLAAMVVIGVGVNALYPAHWQEVPATVESVEIGEVRYGSPEWTVRVDAAYDLAGETYRTQQDVFRNADWDVADAETANWPAGRVFPLYVNADHPVSVSLVPDGGREATVVAAVMLTPMLLIPVVLIVFLIRRARRNG